MSIIGFGCKLYENTSEIERGNTPTMTKTATPVAHERVLWLLCLLLTWINPFYLPMYKSPFQKNIPKMQWVVWYVIATIQVIALLHPEWWSVSVFIDLLSCLACAEGSKSSLFSDWKKTTKLSLVWPCRFLVLVRRRMRETDTAGEQDCGRNGRLGWGVAVAGICTGGSQ